MPDVDRLRQNFARPSASDEHNSQGMKKKNPHAGSDFDDFLKDEGIHKRVTAAAKKRNRAYYVIGRLPEALQEFFFVLGAKRLLKPSFKQPPDWAIGAIRVLCDKGGPFHAVMKMRKPGKEWTSEDLGMAMGMILNGATFLKEGSQSLVADEKKNPVLKKCRQKTAALAAECISEQSRMIKPMKNDALPKIKGVKQMTEYQKGGYRGATTLFDEDGEMREESLTVQICEFIWFFWPLLPLGGKEFTVRKLNVWLVEGPGIHASEKQVEKVCKRIGLRGGKRGRPKNKPISA